MDRRNALITSGSIAAVVTAAVAALSLNVGILDRADPGQVGQLATADLQSSTPLVAISASPDTGSVSRTIDVAGIAQVTVTATTGPDGIDRLEIGSIDASDGWRAATTRTGAASAEVELTDGTTINVVSVTAAGDQISAAVHQRAPVSAVASSATGTRQTTAAQHEGEHESHEYEGGEDDD